MCRCLHTKTKIQRGGGAGAKTAKASACEDIVSKMIDFCESAVKLLNPKNAPHMISGGHRWPALSHV